MECRAIQIGIRGEMVHRYINDWIIDLEEVTGLALACGAAARNRTDPPEVPEERIYPVSDAVRLRLQMDRADSAH